MKRTGFGPGETDLPGPRELNTGAGYRQAGPGGPGGPGIFLKLMCAPTPTFGNKVFGGNTWTAWTIGLKANIGAGFAGPGKSVSPGPNQVRPGCCIQGVPRHRAAAGIGDHRPGSLACLEASMLYGPMVQPENAFFS